MLKGLLPSAQFWQSSSQVGLAVGLALFRFPREPGFTPDSPKLPWRRWFWGHRQHSPCGARRTGGCERAWASGPGACWVYGWLPPPRAPRSPSPRKQRVGVHLPGFLWRASAVRKLGAWRLAHRSWVVGTSAAVAVPLGRSLRPSLSIPASELASCSHLPPRDTQATVSLLLQDAYSLDPWYRSPASLKPGIQDNSRQWKHPRICVQAI